MLAALTLFREFGREAREAEQRVSFVNRVSHELKTPLTSIRMYAELLEESLQEDEGPARKHAGIIVSESQRLSRLIGNVLTFAKKDRGKLGFHPTPVVIDQVVEKVLAQLSPSLESRSIRIEVEHGAPARVTADPDLVIQVLANLITNVEKYAAAGGLLRIRTLQEPGSTRIVVIDRGPGIRADQREKVFEPFHRGDERLDEDSSGTGIGLSIVRDLTRMHGGDAWIEPSPEGTEFHVTFATQMTVEEEG
jgi:signal transduction histidine kinase